MLHVSLIEKIIDYLSGRISLSDLEGWLVPHLPSLYALPFPQTREIVDSLEFGLAEMHAGILLESEFRQQLARTITERPIFLSYPRERPVVQTGTSSSTCLTAFESQGSRQLRLSYSAP